MNCLAMRVGISSELSLGGNKLQFVVARVASLCRVARMSEGLKCDRERGEILFSYLERFEIFTEYLTCCLLNG